VRRTLPCALRSAELTAFIGRAAHQEYYVTRANPLLQKLPADAGVPSSLWLGVLGMPSMTAYSSWKEYAKPQKGQTVFVSSAAGAVGSVVVQLAKRDGMKVIASSGSDEKVQFAKECGADVSFNYKTTSTEEIMAKEGPIDVCVLYFVINLLR
jgi:NADPH-dependent curcumin reductase CurA